MDVERVPSKKPRKAADGEASKAAAPAPPTATEIYAWSPALDEERQKAWRKMMATPLTEDELRQAEEEREKLISGTWEKFRDNWIYGGFPFDAVSTIPCMRYTDADLSERYNAYHCKPRDALQIVAVQLSAFSDSLNWPLDVYGFVFIHDVLDRKRIMVFNREREDCHSINKQDPYLRLTGPTRGVLVNHGPSFIEVVLKVKGGLTESEDKDLSKFATTIRVGCPAPIGYTSKLCTLEMQHYTVYSSVEATVSVRVSEGQWPHGFRGVLNASTAGQEDIQIALLHLNDDELPVDSDGFIKLSRRVVCVEHDGKLRFSLLENGVREEGVVRFAAQNSRRTTRYMHVKKFGLRLEVTVAWSLF